MEEKKDLVEVKAKELVVFEDDLGFTGFEGVDNDAGSFQTPFLKVLNADSPARKEGTDTYIEGSHSGDFFNSVTEEVYGRTIDLIIIYSERVYNEYKPDRGGFVGTHDRVEGASLIRDTQEYPFINKKTGNNLVETQTLFCLNANDIESGPVIFPLAGTSLKEAKGFLSIAKRRMMIKNGKKVKAPLYTSVYRFETRLKNDGVNSWWKVFKSSIKRIGDITSDQVVAIKEAYKLFQDKGIDYSKYKEEETQQEFDFDDSQDGNIESNENKSPF